MKHFFYFQLFCLWLGSLGAKAQDEDLFKLMDNNQKPTVDYTTATFKSTRIINGHSVENMAAKHLDFRISHRFGRLNSGADNLWGLDEAHIRLGLEYGISNRLMVGLGRSSQDKEIDAFAKFKLLRQSTGAKKMPLSVSLVGGAVLTTKPQDQFFPAPVGDYPFSNRLFYIAQVLVARKFGERLSLQLSPTFIRRNVVATPDDPFNVFSLGVGGRIKLSKRISFNVDYFYVFSDQVLKTRNNSLAVGFDIETGGHVFQLHFTNSLGMNEKMFITETTGSWGQGDIHYGFNISRTFSLAGKK